MTNGKVLLIKVDDVKEASTVEQLLDLTEEVAIDSVTGVFKGIVNTAEDVACGCVKLTQGKVGEAADIAKGRVTNMIEGTLDGVKSAAALTEAGFDAVVNDKAFLTDTNKKHMKRVCRLGLYGALTGVISRS